MSKASGVKQPPPAPEGGWGWVAIPAAFIVHVITSGYMLSISVFLVEWRLFFDTDAKTVGYVGVILGFLGPTMGLPAGGLSKTFGCRTVAIIAGLSLSLSMLLAMFATKLYHLYLTTLITAIGIGFSYQPAVIVIGHYFQQRLGLANGIAMSGVGIGMLVVSPFLQFLIDTFTWQKSFLILCPIALIVSLCGLLFRPSQREMYYLKEKAVHKHLKENPDEGEEKEGNFKPQEPKEKSTSNQSRALTFYLLRGIKFFGLHLIWRHPSINFIFIAFGLLGCGFYSSLVFFTSKAVFDLNISQSKASWLISLVGMGSFTFRLCHGFLIDLKILSPMMIFVLAALVCSVSDLLNPFTNSFAGLAVCAFCLGAGSGLAIAVTIVCIREAVHPVYVSNAWGITMMGFGCGNLIGVYLMAFLYDATGTYNISFFVGAAILFLAALSMFSLWILHHRKGTNKKQTDQEVKMTKLTENGPSARQFFISEEEKDEAGESDIKEKT
ncbi:Monocarboxylate transporter 12 [Holothuria leucospilota]|uniref:Monocarboxylate transporter 12 n=1 Tax=Holothuria leucospilota TaxID=206669 RepID=A0A9Q1BQJ8_HOLLE|nr:Monocarboxylate transporter 12 [Holothuria leucospilota]